MMLLGRGGNIGMFELLLLGLSTAENTREGGGKQKFDLVQWLLLPITHA